MGIILGGLSMMNITQSMEKRAQGIVDSIVSTVAPAKTPVEAPPVEEPKESPAPVVEPAEPEVIPDSSPFTPPEEEVEGLPCADPNEEFETCSLPSRTKF